MNKRAWRTENWWVSPYNFREEYRNSWNLPKFIKIHDATLRDGEQTPGVVLKKEEKIRIAEKLSEVGIHRIEAGMPAVSEEDREAITEIKKLNLPSTIFGFVRAKEEDIAIAKDCGVDGVIIEVPIGKPKLDYQFKWSVDRVIENSIFAIKKAKELDLYTVYFPYDTTRAEENDLVKLLNEIKKYAMPDSVGVVDTMGCALPGATDYLVRLVKSIMNIPVEIHTHNDFGMALANSITAVMAGAEVVHCCVNGIGERTGNCSTEEIIVALEILMNIDIGVNISKLQELSDLVRDTTGFEIVKNKPIVGPEIFTRESGIGADAIFKMPLSMFALNPEFLNKKAKLVLGKKSGLMSINVKLQEYNIELEEEQKQQLLLDVKRMGMEKKGNLTDEEFLILVRKYKS
ncbi:LeuA family protein [Thermosediminibacter litoriperuensis]|uniref:Methanogen homocitrate synthase n=1 Tax=Thermosediminibacter litoriperuensis TaxID=291989 RepID=A0A5S5AHZ5_9FIRM|nr:2-isopropylmalate synthase [Thermosediminibacter litoriperuensis]TYP49798.1 methanogen homocitrate synthase [Thermosediminibacter litoriperuensis]